MIQASSQLVQTVRVASKAAVLSGQGIWQGDLAFTALGGVTAGALGLAAFAVPRLFQGSASEAQCVEGN